MTTYEISRFDLEEQYVDAALTYLSLSTNRSRSYTALDIRNPRFNIFYEVNMHPRWATLDERDSARVSGLAQEVASAQLHLWESQLCLLTGVETSHTDIQSNSQGCAPSMACKGVLQSASVLVEGVYTPLAHPDDISMIVSPLGDRFTDDFVTNLRGTAATNRHLSLVA